MATERASEEDQLRLAYVSAKAEKLKEGDTTNVTPGELQAKLSADGVNATATEGEEGAITVEFTTSGNTYTILPNGTINQGTNGGGSNPTPTDPEPTIQAGETAPSDKNATYSDGTNTATIPAGFTVSNIDGEKTIANGLVIYDTQGATNVDWTTAQTTYNQFVWIPVASAESYVRDFSYPSYYDSDLNYTPADSTFTDTGYLPEGMQPETDSAEANETAERNAVVNAGGFYISRYEAGDGSTTSNRSSSSGTTGELVSKKNAFVYNYINQTNSKAKAKTMYSGKTALCSGIQWDMVMKFVDGKKDAEGTDNFDVRTVNSSRHTGSLAKTGANNHDKVQNIYDLEGNTEEYVAEKNATSNPFVGRGGSYYGDSYHRASLHYNHIFDANRISSFRVTLYVK